MPCESDVCESYLLKTIRRYPAAAGISERRQRLAEARFDAVLLDLSLPDSQGLDTLVRLHEAAKDEPVVVLTGIEDEAPGVRLIQAGAQD